MDEVAFQVGGQPAGGCHRPHRACASNLREHSAQRLGGTRYGRRAERRDPIARKTAGNIGNGIALVQRVMPLDAVNVGVHKARNNITAARIDNVCAGSVDARPFFDGRDPRAINDERRAGENAIRQNEIGTYKSDH
jgi:hypothetical protein